MLLGVKQRKLAAVKKNYKFEFSSDMKNLYKFVDARCKERIARRKSLNLPWLTLLLKKRVSCETQN